MELMVGFMSIAPEFVASLRALPSVEEMNH